MKCNTCANENYCYDGNHQLTRDGCADNGFAAYVSQTNADRIRQMSDEELAEWMAINTSCFFCKVKNQNICSLDEGTCTEEWLLWLKSPADMEGEGC